MTARETPTKVCTRCRRSVPLERFSPMRRMRDGRSSWCRDCASEATRAWRGRRREYVAAHNVARRVCHDPRICESCGLTFTPNRADRRFCCATCGDSFRANGGRRTPEGAAYHIRTCHPQETAS